VLRARQQLPWHLYGRQRVPLQPAAVLEQQAAAAGGGAEVASEWAAERFVTTGRQQQGQAAFTSHASTSAAAAGAQQQQQQQQQRAAGPEPASAAKGRGLSQLLGIISSSCSTLLGRGGPGDPGGGAGSSSAEEQQRHQQQQQHHHRQRQQRQRQEARAAAPPDDVDLGRWDELAHQVWGGSGGSSVDTEVDQEQGQQPQRPGGRGTDGGHAAAMGRGLVQQLGGLPYALLLETLQMQQRMDQAAPATRARQLQVRALRSARALGRSPARKRGRSSAPAAAPGHAALAGPCECHRWPYDGCTRCWPGPLSAARPLQLVAEYQSELLLGIPLENSAYARHILAARGQQLPWEEGGGRQGRGGGAAVHGGAGALFSQSAGAQEGGGWRVVAFDEELVAEDGGGGWAEGEAVMEDQ
jgi:hypothetical protein